MAKKKKKSAEEAAKDGNVILFTALSMILLAFFIVLNSIAVIDQNRKLEAWGSLLGGFGILPGGVLLEKGDQLLPYESPILTEGEMYEDIMLQTERFIVDYQLVEDVGFSYEGRNLTISISSDLLFLPDSLAFNPKNIPFLNLLTRLVGAVENRVRISGYMNKEEAAGHADPWNFSLNRAIKVLDHMLERGNLMPERFSIGGYGAEKPYVIAAGGLKRKDSRIDITLVGEVRLDKGDDEKGLYRYKGFVFDFKERSSGGR